MDILEKRLTEIFHLASHWKAALLLDEADVFVEERARNDQRRNALVCAFLRKLEYYEGILFLTTNRVETMDAAIASRIHLAVPYRNLEQSARMRVWRCFLSKAMTAKGAAALPEEDIERLARKVLNGREVSCSRPVMGLADEMSRSRMLYRRRAPSQLMRRAESACHTSRRQSTSTSSFSRISAEPVKSRICILICKVVVSVGFSWRGSGGR